MGKQTNDRTKRSLAELRFELGARAAGYWWSAGQWLEQIAFAPSPALPADVAQAFAEATRSVALSRTDLGIVRAAVSGSAVVSRASELADDTDSGSGYWLRAFGATRSVAVALYDPSAVVRAVVSVALPADNTLDDDAVVERIRAAVRHWAPLL